ncbi:PTPA-CTERM sorting domain-containing protein [Pantanalinema rosaneae CENA516]|uniref:PTPA-CTERM sorting domain-containing protein n=1 Tax=Pantanalinema rosaneae TaxID=1620701 RepID=UPI003D6E9E89
MTLKTFHVGMVVAATVASNTILSTTPAQAAKLTGVLNFTGAVTFDTVGNPTKLTFEDSNSLSPGLNFAVDLASTTLAFDTPEKNQVTGTGKVAPKVINLVGGEAGPFPNWLTGLKVEGKDLTFNLTKFVLGSASIRSLPGGFTRYVYDSDISGKFFADGEFLGSGVFTTQFVLTAEQINQAITTSYSGTIAAYPVPTPALLPGLIGLGLGVMRKRKTEAIEEAAINV